MVPFIYSCCYHPNATLSFGALIRITGSVFLGTLIEMRERKDEAGAHFQMRSVGLQAAIVRCALRVGCSAVRGAGQ